MAAITINDLPACRLLDLKAMSSFRGAGAPWVYGWIRPFVGAVRSVDPVVNFYQINNFQAEQMNNQFQVINVSNLAPNSNISVVAEENGVNTRLL